MNKVVSLLSVSINSKSQLVFPLPHLFKSLYCCKCAKTIIIKNIPTKATRAAEAEFRTESDDETILNLSSDQGVKRRKVRDPNQPKYIHINIYENKKNKPEPRNDIFDPPNFFHFSLSGKRVNENF